MTQKLSGEIRRAVLKLLLLWQALYYGVTGVWALAALDNFSRVTKDHGDALEMHSIAALAVVLAIAFVRGAIQEQYLTFAAWLLFTAALAVIIPELAHFSDIKCSLFFADLLEEIAVAVAVLFT